MRKSPTALTGNKNIKVNVFATHTTLDFRFDGSMILPDLIVLRARSAVVNRTGLEELRTLLERFQTATRSAAQAGDALARSVSGGTPETMLRRLGEHWEKSA